VQARVLIDGRELAVDLSRPVDIALELDFTGAQPRHFGAPRASARAYETADLGFRGSVERGASCNCEVTPPGLIPAVLLSVWPEPPGGEGTEPAPQPLDRLITRRAIERAWPAAVPFVPYAVVIRTLPNTADKRARDYTGETPPYLSQEAAALLVGRGVAHLVVDVPSIDRAHDEGRLTAHRLFFGLPRGAVGLAAATRPAATITELAFIPDALADGAYLLELQVPALTGDAVPSRPRLYAVTESRS